MSDQVRDLLIRLWPLYGIYFPPDGIPPVDPPPDPDPDPDPDPVTGWATTIAYKIATDGVTGTIPTSARIPFDITEPALRTTGNSGSVTNASGHDIRLELADETPVRYQRDSYNSSTGRLTGWLRLPSGIGTAQVAINILAGKSGEPDHSNAAETWSGYVFAGRGDGTNRLPGGGQFTFGTGVTTASGEQDGWQSAGTGTAESSGLPVIASPVYSFIYKVRGDGMVGSNRGWLTSETGLSSPQFDYVHRNKISEGSVPSTWVAGGTVGGAWGAYHGVEGSALGGPVTLAEEWRGTDGTTRPIVYRDGELAEVGPTSAWNPAATMPPLGKLIAFLGSQVDLTPFAGMLAGMHIRPWGVNGHEALLMSRVYWRGPGGEKWTPFIPLAASLADPPLGPGVIVPAAPSVITQPATGIDQTVATLNGALTSVGTATPQRWFEWRQGTSGSWTETTKVTQATSGPFSQALAGLTANTQYQFRAVAENSVGIVFGSTVSFTTTAAGVVPSVTTNTATSVTTTGATLQGNLTVLGSPGTPTRFFQWRPGTAGAWTETSKISQPATGPFPQAISGLAPSTAHQFRAAAENSAGQGFGAIGSFTTGDASPPPPPPGGGSGTPLPPVTGITRNVNSGNIGSALSAANPGDHIVLANGSYGRITMSRSGTAANPIVIRAANILEAVVGGLTLNASHVVVYGLDITANSVVGANTGNKLWRCQWRNCGDQALRLNNSCTHLDIAYCRWQNITRRGLLTAAATNVTIRYTMFRDSTGGDSGNDGEAIHWSFGPPSRVTNGFVYRCKFRNWSQGGEAELISVKCSGNTFRQLTVENCWNQAINNRFGRGNLYDAIWTVNSGGVGVHDGCGSNANRVLGCRTDSPSGNAANIGIVVRAGTNPPCTFPNGTGPNDAAGECIVHGCTGPLTIGRTYSNSTSPARGTNVRQHTGPISYGLHTGSNVQAGTPSSLSWSPLIWLADNDVGPFADL